MISAYALPEATVSPPQSRTCLRTNREHLPKAITTADRVSGRHRVPVAPDHLPAYLAPSREVNNDRWQQILRSSATYGPPPSQPPRRPETCAAHEPSLENRGDLAELRPSAPSASTWPPPAKARRIRGKRSSPMRRHPPAKSVCPAPLTVRQLESRPAPIHAQQCRQAVAIRPRAWCPAVTKHCNRRDGEGSFKSPCRMSRRMCMNSFIFAPPSQHARHISHRTCSSNKPRLPAVHVVLARHARAHPLLSAPPLCCNAARQEACACVFWFHIYMYMARATHMHTFASELCAPCVHDPASRRAVVQPHPSSGRSGMPASWTHSVVKERTQTAIGLAKPRVVCRHKRGGGRSAPVDNFFEPSSFSRRSSFFCSPHSAPVGRSPWLISNKRASGVVSSLQVA